MTNDLLLINKTNYREPPFEGTLLRRGSRCLLFRLSRGVLSKKSMQRREIGSNGGSFRLGSICTMFRLLALLPSTYSKEMIRYEFYFHFRIPYPDR